MKLMSVVTRHQRDPVLLTKALIAYNAGQSLRLNRCWVLIMAALMWHFFIVFSIDCWLCFVEIELELVIFELLNCYGCQLSFKIFLLFFVFLFTDGSRWCTPCSIEIDTGQWEYVYEIVDKCEKDQFDRHLVQFLERITCSQLNNFLIGH